ncbi:cAMP-binding protein [Arcticibacter svalbardensis MN12-7]|uniref:cAMP-binding protein n=1 Tax=Arcticibacter svalbardensis MN12-7 TaxID=1150600 RepID=R9GXI5_9SPHI|nr:Crp/Fnr family transcriptional regulator [Arcticibacter svalbardensis]EOR93649.1 cAMP-binding protein [Arcticibacter svalbardensis MN12-7]
MQLSSYINQILPLADITNRAIESAFVPVKFSKTQILIPEGKISKEMFFIEKGLARIYYYNESGKDITYSFFTEGMMLTVAESFFGQLPSRYNIESLEDCEMRKITYTDFEMLLKTYPETEKVKSQGLLEFLLKATDRIVTLQFLSAQERYDLLMKNYPSIILRASLGHIASYLGITQETLSRIRAKK